VASFQPRRNERQPSTSSGHRSSNFSRNNGPRTSFNRNNGPHLRSANFNGPPHNSNFNGPPANLSFRGPPSNFNSPQRSFSNRSDAARDARAYADNTCLYCHTPGHYASECNKKRRDREFERRSSHQANQRHPPANPQFSAIAFTANTTSNTVNDKWILDTGATRHITPHLELLTNLRPAPQAITVTFGNGSTAEATQVGDAYLQPNPNNIIKLVDVLFMPGAADNLLSISQATQRGINFAFNATDCRISMDNQLIAIGHANTSSNIYHLPSNCLKPGSAAHAMTTAYTARADTPELWHRRLGHLGYDNLAKLTTMATGININSSDFKATSAATCNACNLGKDHRLPFNASTSATTKPLELLHTDLCGPMPVTSHGGNLFFITILDDFTGFSFIAPLRRKSDAADFLKTTITLLERQTSFTVKCIRSDNGGEFINSDLATFYQSKGIKSETTVPYTPQQNGKAERLNRTLLDVCVLHYSLFVSNHW